MLERSFKNGKMTRGVENVIIGDDDDTSGYLPFYSVDTYEEVFGILKLALEAGEIVQKDGRYYETTLMYDQTIENLTLAGERLAELHGKWKESHADH